MATALEEKPVLGYLTWTHVADSELTHAAVEHLDGLPVPGRPLPVDVFRRLTGVDGTSRYTVDDFEVVLTAQTAQSPSSQMLVRHIVAEVCDGEGVTQNIHKVGDVAFYKPPKGQPSKARIRITPNGVPGWLSDTLTAFTEALRRKYDEGIAGQLDDQAVRRIVRKHLTETACALYIEGGLYFTLDTECIAPLEPLFDLLGPNSVLHSVPVPDTARDRELLRRMVDRSLARSVVVDGRIRERLEVAHAN